MTDKKTDPTEKSLIDKWVEGYGNERMLEMWLEDDRTVEQMLTEGIMPKKPAPPAERE